MAIIIRVLLFTMYVFSKTHYDFRVFRMFLPMLFNVFFLIRILKIINNNIDDLQSATFCTIFSLFLSPPFFLVGGRKSERTITWSYKRREIEINRFYLKCTVSNGMKLIFYNQMQFDFKIAFVFTTICTFTTVYKVENVLYNVP